MSDETRREFLLKAGMAATAAAAVGVASTQPAEAAELLPAEKFARFYDDVFRLLDDPTQKNVSIAEVIKRHGLKLDLPKHVGERLNPLLDRRPGMIRPGRGSAASSSCGACGACGLCAICGEADVLSGLAAAAAVTALGATM